MLACLGGVASTAAEARADLAAGDHDYRGTVGGRRVAVHLERKGATLEGAYLYDAIGKEIALAGVVEPDGRLALAERVDGRATGTLRLAADGSALTGTWLAPAGTKAMPVSLATAAPWVKTLTRRAERCLVSLTCPVAEAERLFVAADDAREEAVSCYRFLDGAGAARDAARGRACLERGTASCSAGSSGLLALAELALARIDGVGGPRDVGGGRALFDRCADDATKGAVLSHAAEVERDPARHGPVSFCRDVGGTTLTMNECGMRGLEAERTAAAIEAKAIASHLDWEGRRRFVAANEAYAAYASAAGNLAYQAYVDGSVRSAVALGVENQMLTARTDELKDFAAFAAGDASTEGAARAERASAEALAAVKTWSAEEAAALAATQVAWVAYREAEVGFYVHVFGATQGGERVRAAIVQRLEGRRAKECGPPGMGGD